MKNMSGLYELVSSLPVDAEGEGFVEKNSSARDLIMQLPTPSNLKRRRSLIPSANVKLYLSTGEKLPPFIMDQVRQSENNMIFGDESLMGLCLNGRGLPVEIFIHEPQIQKLDSSGNLFDEIAWHELVHGIEGIKNEHDGTITRDVPWSFRLQEVFVKATREKGEPDWQTGQTPETIQIMRYLREGTDLQQSVSELFARVAAIYMMKIRNTGIAPLPGQFPDFKELGEEIDLQDREVSNTLDIYLAFSTYSDDCIDVFNKIYPEMIKRISRLYGCDLPALRPANPEL